MSAEGKAIAPMKIACIFGRISKLVPEAAFNLEAAIFLELLKIAYYVCKSKCHRTSKNVAV